MRGRGAHASPWGRSLERPRPPGHHVKPFPRPDPTRAGPFTASGIARFDGRGLSLKSIAPPETRPTGQRKRGQDGAGGRQEEAATEKSEDKSENAISLLSFQRLVGVCQETHPGVKTSRTLSCQGEGVFRPRPAPRLSLPLGAAAGVGAAGWRGAAGAGSPSEAPLCLAPNLFFRRCRFMGALSTMWPAAAGGSGKDVSCAGPRTASA